MNKERGSTKVGEKECENVSECESERVSVRVSKRV